MKPSIKKLDATLREVFAPLLADDAPQPSKLILAFDELTLEIPADTLLATMQRLRDWPALAFDALADVTAIDYLDYHNKEEQGIEQRFAVVYHLLSTTHNWRVRVRVFLPDDVLEIPSVEPIWPAANWMERETYDMFGIHFTGHPDPRRILTDYGFEGYPFRKDFPLEGHLEIRYDEELRRIVYEPVTIPPRENIPSRHREPYYADETATPVPQQVPTPPKKD
jgi:NADH (or F420H2) dehydrogenase, subunit C